MESGEAINLDSRVEANGTSKETPAPVASEKSTTSEGNSNGLQSPTNNSNSKENSTTMVKQKGENEIDDGAQERMLKDDNKITPNKDASEVKFISENGDAKIDIETVKQSLSGMGKEELMKFANDPFWIRLRWALFIFFWFLWFAMLGGAIAIIVMAPKCSSPQPKQWWEESAIIQLDPSTDSPNKTLMGLESVLDELKEQDIKAISLISLIKANIPGHIVDFKDIQSEFGTLVDVETFTKAAKDRGQHVILEFDPNHSSTEHPWFKRSVSKEDPYTSYYVWADPKPSSDGKRQPPNNWLSMDGGSAWEWNEERGQYYYHQFKKSQPDLNHNNSAVVKEFEGIFTHWLKLGISGFRLANTQYLTEDPSLRSESQSNIPAEADDYQSLFHVHTKDRPENAYVLTKWQEVVSNFTQGEGLFTLQDDIGADILAVYNEKKSLINLPQSSQFLVTADADIKASTLQKGVQQWLNISSWPAWDLNGKERSLRQRVPADVADSLTLMTLLLPGTPILRLNDTSSSAKEAFTTLSKARSGLTFLYGDIISKTVNESIFAYTRLKSGNPGYLVMYHSGDKPVTVDVSVMPKVSEEVSIFTHSPNYVQEGDLMNTKLSSKGVPISPKSTLVLTFVPKKE